MRSQMSIASLVTPVRQVTRPTLKTDAENVVKNVEGVRPVVNDIKVLPLSPDDNRIRTAVYQAIYAEPALNATQCRQCRPFTSSWRMAP